MRNKEAWEIYHDKLYMPEEVVALKKILARVGVNEMLLDSGIQAVKNIIRRNYLRGLKDKKIRKLC